MTDVFSELRNGLSSEILLRTLDTLAQRVAYERNGASDLLARTVREGQAALGQRRPLRRWGSARAASLDDIRQAIDPTLTPNFDDTGDLVRSGSVDINTSACLLAIHALLYNLPGADPRSVRLSRSTINPSLPGGAVRSFLGIAVDSPHPGPDGAAGHRAAVQAATELCVVNGGWLHTTGDGVQTHTLVFAEPDVGEPLRPLVLCIDDDVMCRKVMGAMCARSGSEVISVSGYHDAAEAVKGRFFSMALLDRRIVARRGARDSKIVVERRQLEQPVRDRCGHVVYVTGEQRPNHCEDSWLMKPAHIEELTFELAQSMTHDRSSAGGVALGEVRRLLHGDGGCVEITTALERYAAQIRSLEMERLSRAASGNTPTGGGVVDDDIWRVLERYN
jgi:hypothetical protein